MLQWTKGSALWSNHSAVATCEHANSASFSTRLQLTGRDAEPEEPCKYVPGNPGLMAPEDPRAEAASPGATLLETLVPAISELMVPCGAPLAPKTSVANIIAGR
jgi:hypothetical protein